MSNTQKLHNLQYDVRKNEIWLINLDGRIKEAEKLLANLKADKKIAKTKIKESKTALASHLNSIKIKR